MNPDDGDVALERLHAFIGHASTENEPTDEGWELFSALAEAVNELGDAYESSIPKHQAPPAVVAYDTGFVEFFHRINGDMWSRTPGDKLTIRQRIDIMGQILMVVLVIALVGGVLTYMGVHSDEWELGRRTTQ